MNTKITVFGGNNFFQAGGVGSQVISNRKNYYSQEETAVICPVCGEVDYVTHDPCAVKSQSCEECNAFFVVRFKGDGVYETEVRS